MSLWSAGDLTDSLGFGLTLLFSLPNPCPNALHVCAPSPILPSVCENEVN